MPFINIYKTYFLKLTLIELFFKLYHKNLIEENPELSQQIPKPINSIKNNL